MAVSGNPQLNIRLEIDLMDKVKEEAEKQGMKPQEWVRRLIKETLGEVSTNVVLSTDNATATTVSKDEFETAIASLTKQIESVPQREPVDIGGLNSRLDQLLDMQGDIIGRVNKLEDSPQPVEIPDLGKIVSEQVKTAIAPLSKEIDDLKKSELAA